MSSSESALVKPFRNVYRIIGALFDAVYYFFESLISPPIRGVQSSGRLNSSRRSGPSSGARINTLRPPGSGTNAPNMNIGGCRSCQM